MTFCRIDIDYDAQEYKNEFVCEAVLQASKSPMATRHGAVIVYNGKIVATGHNKYSKSCHDPKKKISIHAEVDAISNLSPRLPGHKLTLYVVRIDIQGMLKMSKPCGHCMEEIISKKLKTTYYSTELLK